MRPRILPTGLGLLLPLLFLPVACGDPPPPKSPSKSETVPANSLSDARMKGEEDPQDHADREAAKKNEGSTNDPSKPYTTKVGDPSPPPPASSSASDADPKKSSSKPNGAVVSKNECDRVMDKYLELEIVSNPQLKGVPPEVIEQAKQMARAQHGESPCTATRAQYTCAMNATSTVTWQKCMK